jgi:hypothetical protein
VVFVPPSCSSGGMVGEGTIDASFASGGALIVKAGTAIDGTYAHESGHNYGFTHANARRFGSSVEYYGAYDVMGFALGGYNQLTALSTPYRVFQGITDVGEIKDVSLGSTSRGVRATATIRPRSHDAGLRSVRVVDPGTGKAPDGAPIPDATAKDLLLVAAQLGERITVKVTGSRPGYASRARVSAATARVG